jgi:hypothetical protein
MTDNTGELYQADDVLLAAEISDEALEASVTMTNAAYTLGGCTGLSACPA